VATATAPNANPAAERGAREPMIEETAMAGFTEEGQSGGCFRIDAF